LIDQFVSGFIIECCPEVTPISTKNFIFELILVVLHSGLCPEYVYYFFKVLFPSKRERKNRDTNSMVFVTVFSFTCFQIVSLVFDLANKQKH